MQPNESTFARLGLFGLALVHWHAASAIVRLGFMPAHPMAVTLVIVLYLTSFALILGALARRPVRQASEWVFPSLALIVLAYTFIDVIDKQHRIGMTTDAHGFMDLAARMVVRGKNPYRESLLEAFRIQQMPLSFATPLTDGDLSDRTAYPALAFLVLVPFVLLHVPTHLAYALAFVGALVLVLRRTPWWARGMVVVLFAYDDAFISMSFGGVTDSVWMLCLVGAILTWSRPTLPFVLVGLACAYKQHPWFLVPFLVVLLCREERVPPWRGRPRRLLVVVASVFVVANLPFVVLDARAWASGMLEPLVAPMITLSEGLSALTMTGYVVFPRLALKLLFWAVYAYALFAYARHTTELRRWCWVLPGILLWFSNRALMSYWYFYALPGLAALVVMDDDPDGREDARASSARTTRIVGAALALGMAALAIGSAFRSPPFSVEVVGPIQTFGRRALQARLLVTNRQHVRARPRFSTQSGALQPLAWSVQSGPSVLAPGQSAELVVAAPHVYEEFDITTGARLAVSADGDPGSRTFIDLPADPETARIDALPNGAFTYVDRRTSVPFGWTFRASDPEVTITTAPRLEDRERVAIRFAPATGGNRDRRQASLSTIVALPEAEISIDVWVPAGANRAPWTELYGLRLDEAGFHAWVLLGEPGYGVLPDGEAFVVLAAPREQWTRVTFDLRALLQRAGAPLVRRSFVYERAFDIDVPTVAVEVSLAATLPPDHEGRARFGRVQQQRPSPDLLTRRGLEDPAGLQAWHAALDARQQDPEKAAALLASAVATQPTAERLLALGEAQQRSRRSAEAVTSYERALALGPSPRALRGLVTAHETLDHCEVARSFAQRLRELEPGWPPLDPCPGR